MRESQWPVSYRRVVHAVDARNATPRSSFQHKSLIPQEELKVSSRAQTRTPLNNPAATLTEDLGTQGRSRVNALSDWNRAKVPALVAVQAQADQLINELGLSQIFRNWRDGGTP